MSLRRRTMRKNRIMLVILLLLLLLSLAFVGIYFFQPKLIGDLTNNCQDENYARDNPACLDSETDTQTISGLAINLFEERIEVSGGE